MCVEAGSLNKPPTPDAAHHTRSYEDGVNILAKLGVETDSDCSERTLVAKSATSSYSEMYSCKSNGQSDFSGICEEVKGDTLSFSLSRVQKPLQSSHLNSFSMCKLH